MKKCDQVMTKNPDCCLPDDMVSQIAQLKKGKDIGPIPIIENEQTKKWVGIVTDRDLALKIVAEERDPKSTTAQQVMTPKVVTCASEDVQKALDSMPANRLRRIPIMDSNNGIVWLVAQADVATRVNQPEKTAAIVRVI